MFRNNEQFHFGRPRRSVSPAPQSALINMYKFVIFHSNLRQQQQPGAVSLGLMSAWMRALALIINCSNFLCKYLRALMAAAKWNEICYLVSVPKKAARLGRQGSIVSALNTDRNFDDGIDFDIARLNQVSRSIRSPEPLSRCATRRVWCDVRVL